MGAAVRDHRNAVRDGSESLSAINRNPCPQSPESAMRTKRLHACAERARLRGTVRELVHSSGCLAQNSTHPVGGPAVTSDTVTWESRLGPATAGCAAMALATSAAINIFPDLTARSSKIAAASMMLGKTTEQFSLQRRSSLEQSANENTGSDARLAINVLLTLMTAPRPRGLAQQRGTVKL